MQYKSPISLSFCVPTCVLRKIFMAFVLINFAFATQADSPSDQDIVAAYTYSLAKFVNWPQTSESEADLELCVLADEEQTLAFSALNGREIAKKQLHVVALDGPDAVVDQGCNLLFYQSLRLNDPIVLADQIGNSPILVVSDAPMVFRLPMISLLSIDNKLRFEVNLKKLSENQFHLSAYLLKLAIEVHE